MRYLIVNVVLLAVLIPCNIKRKIGLVESILILIIINVLLTTGIDMFVKYFTFENMTKPSYRHFVR